MASRRKSKVYRVEHNKKAVNQPIVVHSERDMPDGYIRVSNIKADPYPGLPENTAGVIYGKILHAARTEPQFNPYKLVSPGSSSDNGAPVYVQERLLREMQEALAKEIRERVATPLLPVVVPVSVDPASASLPDANNRYRTLVDLLTSLNEKVEAQRAAIVELRDRYGMLSEAVKTLASECGENRLNTSRIAHVLAGENMKAALELVRAG
jgi:hypothetical protein